ncbi:hypothetical protein K493DRAFT_407003 [Basidiobolus meristosporus CBS 931.73]|uniref:Uncharacterized protein n=1 Tax=Basidiobolus meristosporus CBS 931.73 TaxID=1314790 RepID=A0A1Y1YH02_9FUNG|nr:hypothetical protein K493DRAFT_407003 [Basidiobolus meristosporus CBS 931.73]|eukprot:ORX97277.1 hypothetical protein K493DRAFT_407003 [Basidiobolus meristosporus CBS 931.73]
MSRRVLRRRGKDLAEVESSVQENEKPVEISGSGRITRSKVREATQSTAEKPLEKANDKKSATKGKGREKKSKKVIEEATPPRPSKSVTKDATPETHVDYSDEQEDKGKIYSEVGSTADDIITSTPITNRLPMEEGDYADLELSQAFEHESITEKFEEAEQFPDSIEQNNLGCEQIEASVCADDSLDPFGFAKAEKRIKTFKKIPPSAGKSTKESISSETHSTAPPHSTSKTAKVTNSESKQNSSHANGSIDDSNDVEATAIVAHLDTEQSSKKRHSEPVVEISVEKQESGELEEESPKKRRGKGKLRSYSGRKESKERSRDNGRSTNKGAESKVEGDLDSVMAEHRKHFMDIDNFELAEEYVY